MKLKHLVLIEKTERKPLLTLAHTWTPPLACELKSPTSSFLPSLCEVCLLIHMSLKTFRGITDWFCDVSRGQFFFSLVKKFEASRQATIKKLAQY